MRRIAGVVSLLAAVALAASGTGLEHEADTIAVSIGGQPVARPFAGGVNWPRPVLVDIDDDGSLDLILGDQDGSIHYYCNTGTVDAPRFVVETETFAGIRCGGRCTPTFVDIDNDGDLDLFAGEESGTIQFYRNTGTSSSPTFTLEAEEFEEIDVGFCSYPVFADIDDDGDPDLFIGEGAYIWPHYVGGNLTWYRNTGTAAEPAFAFVTDSFANARVQFGGSKPAFADIDADGDLDLLVGTEDGRIHEYENAGTAAEPEFVLVTRKLEGIDVGYGGHLDLADIDNDGDLDLFVSEDNGNIHFYRNTGNAASRRFERVTENFACLLNDVGTDSAPAFADIDNDGDPDLFVGRAHAAICFYRNIGDAMTPIFSLESENYANLFDEYDAMKTGRSVPTFVDIDNDGDLDLFVGVGSGELRFYRNTGTALNPALVRAADFAGIIHSAHVAPTFADIDDDGDLDLFLSHTEGCAFYLNVGTHRSPSFQLMPDAFPSLRLSGLDRPRFVDVDDDEDWDLVVGVGDYTTFLNGGNLILYRNIGTAEEAEFALETENFAGVEVPSHACPEFVDIDGDGDLDLFIGEQDGGLYFFRNR
jgi:hypothetical protein